MADDMTTAEVLRQFRQELLEAEIDNETVRYLVQTAGRELLASSGLIVKEVSRDG
ncbi:hypothetical protein [Streptomyces thermolilacinus]|uniref:hypothetical protein n=1 Tax=Streptomyces thermolilacinus TaxID=285540 RepID=UPI003411476B